MTFKYYQPTEIQFGAGKVNELANIIARYGNNVLLVGPIMNENISKMFDKVEGILKNNNITFTSFYEIESNPSTLTVNKLHKLSKTSKFDVIVGVGGGSVLDSCKIVGLLHGLDEIDWNTMYEKYDDFNTYYKPVCEKTLPLIAISTTAGTGSQCTHASVITSVDGMKLTVFHQDSYAKVAIVDPELTLTLPNSISSSTAFDAFTHAFESYLRNDNNPIAQLQSIKAIENIVYALPKVLKENKIEYREMLSLSDTLAGIALSNCGASLPHPLSEVIGSYVNRLAHGQALAMVYPTFLKYTYKKYESKFAKVCRIFDSSYINETDEVAASNFHLVLEKFLVETSLVFKLSDYCTDKETIETIKNFTLWDVLPLEETSVIHKIVNEICEK